MSIELREEPGYIIKVGQIEFYRRLVGFFFFFFIILEASQFQMVYLFHKMLHFFILLSQSRRSGSQLVGGDYFQWVTKKILSIFID